MVAVGNSHRVLQVLDCSCCPRPRSARTRSNPGRFASGSSCERLRTTTPSHSRTRVLLQEPLAHRRARCSSDPSSLTEASTSASKAFEWDRTGGYHRSRTVNDYRRYSDCPGTCRGCPAGHSADQADRPIATDSNAHSDIGSSRGSGIRWDRSACTVPTNCDTSERCCRYDASETNKPTPDTQYCDGNRDFDHDLSFRP